MRVRARRSRRPEDLTEVVARVISGACDHAERSGVGGHRCLKITGNFKVMVLIGGAIGKARNHEVMSKDTAVGGGKVGTFKSALTQILHMTLSSNIDIDMCIQSSDLPKNS